MKKIISNVLAAASLYFGSCYVATARDAPLAQSNQITGDGQIIQDDDTGTGKSEPVTMDPSVASDVALQFPASLADRYRLVGMRALFRSGPRSIPPPDEDLAKSSLNRRVTVCPAFDSP